MRRLCCTDTFFSVIIIDFTQNSADQLTAVMVMMVALYFEEAGGLTKCDFILGFSFFKIPHNRCGHTRHLLINFEILVRFTNNICLTG